MSVEREIDAELRFHFEARIDELSAQGMSRDAARRQALSEFGDLDDTRATLRVIDSRVAKRRSRVDLFEALIQDAAYSIRALRRTPVVSLAVILTLGLGLGVNATMFSLLDAIYLRPPAAVTAPGEIRRVWSEQNFRTGVQFWSGFDYSGFSAVAHALDGRARVTLYDAGTRHLGRGESAPTVHVVGAAANYFSVLGVKPLLGRFYTAGEDGLTESAPVAVISESFWQRQFNGDPGAIGQQLDFPQGKLTIIGIAARGFRGIELDAADVWMPTVTFLALPPTRRTPWWQDTNVNGFQVVLRLEPAAREGELTQRVTQALRQPEAGGFRIDSTSVAAFGAINAARGPGKVSTEMQVATRLAGVAIIVLLIACANVVNLLLARAVSRRREIAVRLALGVSRSRLVRLLVTESVLLALVAAAAAVAAAHWGGALLRALLMPKIEWADSPIDWRVLAFAFTAALIAGGLAGLVPAVQASSPDLAKSLRAGARDDAHQRSRLRNLLVTSQAALSVVLLVGAVLFVRSLRNVKEHDFGYAVSQLAFASVDFDTRDSARDAAFPARMRALAPRVAAMPGVERVAVVRMRPKAGFSTTQYFPDADTVAHRKPVGFVSGITPSFFEATGTKLLRGRTFPNEAGPGGPLTTIINKAMADALWPNQDPLGRCIRFDAPGAPCATVIGVAQTAMLLSIDEPPTPRFYVSLDNPPSKRYTARDLIIRGDARRLPAVMTAIRALLRTEFPGAIPRLSTMSQTMEPEYRPWDLGAKLFTLFGVLALIVASIGVFSSVSYAVSRRMHEFGVRIALGASGADVVRHVLGEGLKTVVAGIVAGLMLTLAAGKLVGALLYGIRPSDPSSMAIVAVVLLAIALVAALVPAWRAARSDPVSALRSD
jgi:putative ABC transport system permease protein